ncbi:MAG TPA: hypothetical protein VF519_01455 [Mycobacteriales bacterium]|jgi:hypothetical protein
MSRTPDGAADGHVADHATEDVTLADFASASDFGSYGSLLPVVGPGCLQLRSNETVPYYEVQRRLKGRCTDEQADFLEQLWVARLRRRSLADRRPDGR